ncbi:nucleotidyltransferase [Neobacillus niacini]|uniref:nucleotidyltransferase n=1 Tax=Neobacillus niacini TaxID=86668 RepID=UPI003983C904
MAVIKNIGRYCPMNDKGFILSDANQNKIQPEFQTVIEEVIKSYQIHLGTNLHSIYIRGSIPRGLGIYGVSDLDTIAITQMKPSELDLQWTKEVEGRINAQFSCISGVEYSFYHIEEIMETTSFSIIPFMIKTISICVYGEDLSPQLPEYKADTFLGNVHLSKLKEQIELAREDLVDNDDLDDIKDCCVWIMKIIVRAGLALVIEEENLYTRDLFPAYMVFAKHYPEKALEMNKALLYAINPISNVEELLYYLNDFGEWMITESKKWLQVHNPSNAKNYI